MSAGCQDVDCGEEGVIGKVGWGCGVECFRVCLMVDVCVFLFVFVLVIGWGYSLLVGMLWDVGFWILGLGFGIRGRWKGWDGVVLL